MQKVEETSILADIVLKHEELILILNRLGISFGLGNSNIRETARRAGMQPELLICIVNMVVNPHYRPAETLQTFSVMRLIDYLKKENNYFQSQLKLLEKQIKTFVVKSDDKSGNSFLLEKIFNEFNAETLDFLQEKEANLYPSIESVYENYYSPTIEKNERLKPVDFLEEKRDDLTEKLLDIRQLLVKHIKGNYDENALNSILIFSSRLEKEMKNQKLIEANLLKSIVCEMESNIRKARKKRSPEKGFHGHIAISTTKKNILTARETEVLKLVAKGFLNKEVADKLGISLYTVISHRKNITKKLSIKTLSGLTVYAVMNGLI